MAGVTIKRAVKALFSLRSLRKRQFDIWRFRKGKCLEVFLKKKKIEIDKNYLKDALRKLIFL